MKLKISQREESVCITLSVRNINIWRCFRNTGTVYCIRPIFLMSKKDKVLKRMLRKQFGGIQNAEADGKK